MPQVHAGYHSEGALCGEGKAVPGFLPRSFLFYPARRQNELGAFKEAFAERGPKLGEEKIRGY